MTPNPKHDHQIDLIDWNEDQPSLPSSNRSEQLIDDSSIPRREIVLLYDKRTSPITTVTMGIGHSIHHDWPPLWINILDNR